jgi:hypothetical protein
VSGARARRRWRILLLLALLGIFAALKVLFDPGNLGHLDGNYYYQIAHHVSEGNGLVSNVSLYHQGFKTFPHRVNQNPLWLLTLGYAGRWLGLERCAQLIPELLYLVDLILLYFVANRMWWSIGNRGDGLLFREGRIFDFGHAAVLLLGANAVFFRFTSLPYTEALGFGFLFGGLLLLDRAARERSAAWAAGAGLAAGLGLLTRTQMLGLVLALPAALLLCAPRDRRFAGLAAAALGAALVPFVPWAIYLAGWLETLTPRLLIGLAGIQETPEVALFNNLVPTSSLWDYVRDRAAGLLVAFAPPPARSYASHFGWAVYLVPLALIRVAVRSARRPPAFARGIAAERVLGTAVVLAGLGMLIPIHMHHEASFSQGATRLGAWLFGHRHGIPFLLLLLPALAYLDRHSGRGLRLVTAGLLAATVVTSSLALREIMTRPLPLGLSHAETQLVAWLGRQLPPPAVVTTRAQKLGAYSRAGFHWTYCEDSPDRTLALLRHAGADFVLRYLNDSHCPFLAHRESELREVRRFGLSITLLELANDEGPSR